MNIFKKIIISTTIYISMILLTLYFFNTINLLENLKTNHYYKVETFSGKIIGDFTINFPYIGIKKNNKYIIKNLKDNDSIFIILSFIFLYSLIWSYYVWKSIQTEEEEKCLFKRANLEALATQSSMTILAENIHHELNSPLKVIENKINNIKKLLTGCLSEKFLNYHLYDYKMFEKKIKDLNIKELKCGNYTLSVEYIKDLFSLTETSIDQIKGVLTNMASFKQLRYSNGNKTIYELAEGASKILRVIIDHNINVDIDEKLKKFKINHSSGLKNADFLNILLNHFKNSIEANATEIKVFLENKKGNYILINIKDNGNGIPKDMINQLFSPNKSSKNNFVGLRGNGLFLNQKLLEFFGGDIRLKKTEEGEGTEFVLKIPVIEVQ